MKTYKVVLLTIAGILLIFFAGVFIVQGSQNRAIRLDETVKAAKADVTVKEKRRHDLIPNLVDCVKEYDKHEYQTMLEIIEAREIISDKTVEEIQTMISATAEAYPELKSNEQYKELMNELAITENMISEYRENYNDSVSEYNAYVKRFPARMFLEWTGYIINNYERLSYDGLEDAPTNLFEE